MKNLCCILGLLLSSLLLAGEIEPRAHEVAEKVMTAMGGRQNYDNTRYLTWRFFGKRLHVWDKWTGNLRFEDKELLVLMNVNTREGRAWQDGQPITDEAALQEALTKGYESWINDSYWLVMPYKLEDPGVTLVYSGEASTEAGNPAHVLTLTFDNVGVTPENKYEVLVGKDSNLVEQWNFYATADDAEPRFKTPWADWQPHGKILLSADRGRGKHTDVAVFDQLPESVFTDPAPVQLPMPAR